MRSATLTAVILLLLTCHAMAAPLAHRRTHGGDITGGAKIGINYQRLYGNPQWSTNWSTGPMIGAYGVWTKHKIQLRVELLAKMAKAEYVSNKAEIKSGYLDIPVLAQYQINRVISVHAGLEYIRTLSARNTSAGSGSDMRKLLFNSNDIAIAVGTDVHVVNRLSIGARYSHGLFNLNNGTVHNPSTTWKNSSMQLTAGVRIYN